MSESNKESPVSRSRGLFGPKLAAEANLRVGLVLLGVGAAGSLVTRATAGVALLTDVMPIASLFVALLPLCLGFVMLVTAFSLWLGERGRGFTAGAVGVGAVALLAVTAVAVYLPRQPRPLGEVAGTGLSSDAVSLTVVSGLIGVGFGLSANRLVPARAWLFGLVVPFAFSWPDFQGAYTVRTGRYSPVARGPERRLERLSEEAVAAVQASGAIAAQFIAAGAAALAGVTVGYVLRGIRARRRAG